MLNGVIAYEDGGEVEEYDTDGTNQQGADDAMFDPMQYVQGALSWGRKQYGLEPGEQMGFDDGGEVPEQGVIPTGDEAGGEGGGGNPNAINPQKAMAYLTGDGAVSPEIARALEQKVDPQGQLNPTQRAVAAIGVAPTDEAKFGLLQHYRTKYNAYSGAAKAALARGDLGEAAKQATMAMDAVPDGKRTQFAPAQGGLAMMSKPAFARGGKSAQPQQSFDDGGEVYDYTPPEEDVDEEGNPTNQPVVTQSQPTYGEDAPAETAPSAPAPAEAAPEVIPAQQLAAMLDEGFDKKLESATPQPFRTPGSGVSQAWRGGDEEPVGSGVMPAAALDAADAQRAAQLQGWGSAEEKAGPGWLARMGQRALNPPSLGALDVPPATTGSEAATRPPEGITPEEKLAATRGQEQRFRPAAAPAQPAVTAPVTARAPAEGAVIDEDRVNPFTGKVRPMAPGTFGSRQEAARLGGVIPTEEAILDRARAARGAPSDMSAQRRGVIPTGGEGYRPSEKELPTGNYGDSTGTLNVRTKPQNLGVFANRGGAPEGPLSAHDRSVRQIESDAARMFPWVGRDSAKREAYSAQGLKALGERERAESVETLRGDTRIANAETSAAAKIDVADKKAAAAMERDAANNAARQNLARLNNTYKDERQLRSLSSAERRDAAKFVSRSLDAAENAKIRLVGQQVAANPGLKPEKLVQIVDKLAAELGLRTPIERIGLAEMVTGGRTPGAAPAAAPTAAPAAAPAAAPRAAAPTAEQLRSAPVGATVTTPNGTMRKTSSGGWVKVE